MEKNEFVEIEVTTFDDHADLQARIWNQFMRQDIGSSTADTDCSTNLVANSKHGRTVS